MNAERVRMFLLALPHAVETEQFGGLVFWVGDKALGGKMFALLVLDRSAATVLWFPAGQEHFHELLEIEGFVRAPYLARIGWVAAERWGVLRDAEWEEELRAAHARTLDKLSARTGTMLKLPRGEQQRAIKERRKLLAASAASKAAKKS